MNKLYKIVFPAGIDYIHTPSLSRKTSGASGNSKSSAASAPVIPTPVKTAKPSGFFGRWGSTLTVSQPVSGASSPIPADDGPIEELIVSGTAFGHGLFQLVLSLLPAKVKSVVGFFGLQHDRKLALRALTISADKNDVHSVFAGLALMSYHGVVLLMSGYQADEQHIFKQYRAIVDKLEKRYPTGTLWILNRAKILRMAGDADGAIAVLRDGLKPGRPSVFIQADALLIFELAWLLLANREYKAAAETFIRMTEINSWSHATYFFLAAGCYWRIGNYEEADRLLGAIPAAIDKRKIGGKDLPTEVFIKKRLAFYQAKAGGTKKADATGSEIDTARGITINPAEEMGIFWNNHARIQKSIAEDHIRDWLALRPPVDVETPYAADVHASPPSYPTPPPALSTPDELALRALLLGINHRTAGHFAPARAFLLDAHATQPRLATSTWIGGVALFELAVLALKEAARWEDEAAERTSERGSSAEGAGARAASEKAREVWRGAIKEAGERLEAAGALAGSEIDLSSRLESRMAMLRDEIGLKKEILGI
ncbi:hypothetical protein OF83DRAFT_1288704 [Amylostereum chailletii]|nr:hypothetical protein OF83DRAFT_1288704 [Amylostereum chailletii]